MSWWFKDGAYDCSLNRIERERLSAERMGMTLVVEAEMYSDSYNLYLSPCLTNGEVLLYGINVPREVRVKRDSLFYNGDYLWIRRV